MKHYQVHCEREAEGVFLEPFYNLGNRRYNPIEDAEKIQEFLDTLPGLTVDTLRRELLRNTNLNELELYVNQRKTLNNFYDA